MQASRGVVWRRTLASSRRLTTETNCCEGNTSMASKVALIVEWDNARLSEVDRAREMLRRIGAQAVAAARATNAQFDLALIYDPETIEPSVPRTVLAECV